MKVYNFKIISLCIALLTYILIFFCSQNNIFLHLTRSLILAIFFIIITSFLKKNKRISYEITLKGDVFCLAGVFILSAFVGFEYWYILLLLAAIPTIDIVRYIKMSKEESLLVLPKHKQGMLIIEFLLIVSFFSYIYYIGIERINGVGTILFAIGCMIALGGFYFLNIAKNIRIANIERGLTNAYIFLPVGIYAWYLGEYKTHEGLQWSTYFTMALLFCIIMIDVLVFSRRQKKDA